MAARQEVPSVFPYSGKQWHTAPSRMSPVELLYPRRYFSLKKSTSASLPKRCAGGELLQSLVVATGGLHCVKFQKGKCFSRSGWPWPLSGWRWDGASFGTRGHWPSLRRWSRGIRSSRSRSYRGQPPPSIVVCAPRHGAPWLRPAGSAETRREGLERSKESISVVRAIIGLSGPLP